MTWFAPVLAAPAQAWRVDQRPHASTWNSGIGAQRSGGRWNPKGTKAVYCSLDAATAIVEVAVHKGFAALDMVPHMMTAAQIHDPSEVHVVMPADVPNPNWLVPGMPSAGQQRYGADLLAQHLFVAIPSAASRHNWNLIFDPDRAAGHYSFLLQERLSIDPRLNPPVA